MGSAPGPADIYQRAVSEGERRMEQSLLELVATSFIAGFTIVFGIGSFGIVHAMTPERFGGLADIAGALAFGIGLVFLIVGRAELFNENFYDPIAAAFDNEESWMVPELFRLWTVTLVFNLLGGAIMVAILGVDGALPSGTTRVLQAVAEEIVRRDEMAGFANSIAGGVLVTLLSFMLGAVEGTGSRITLAYLVGFLLALGSFDHVAVTVLHVLFGMLFGVPVGLDALATTTAVVLFGNLVGGIGLGTMTHLVQAHGALQSDR